MMPMRYHHVRNIQFHSLNIIDTFVGPIKYRNAVLSGSSKSQAIVYLQKRIHHYSRQSIYSKMKEM